MSITPEVKAEIEAEDPFSVSPNPLQLYMTAATRAVFHKVRYTINKRQGLTCILGGVGYGKTSIIRALFAEFDARDDVEARLIPTPNYSTEFAFLKALSAEFDIPNKRSMLDQENALKEWVGDEHVAGRNVVVFIDEAQRLSNKMLEIVRAMLNFETNRAKMIQFVLAGQLDLLHRLVGDDLEAIESRIVMPNVLQPLSRAETEALLRYRCEYCLVPFPFAADGIDALFEATHGIARYSLKVAAMGYELIKMSNHPAIDAEIIGVALEEGSLKDWMRADTARAQNG
jgi:type II secretory pathway predicted ATPase ExeA